MHRAIVHRLRRVIADFAIVRIGPAIEQQLGELGMMCDAGSAIEGALPFALEARLARVEPRVGIGAGV
jgi:hypothetical protein